VDGVEGFREAGEEGGGLVLGDFVWGGGGMWRRVNDGSEMGNSRNEREGGLGG